LSFDYVIAAEHQSTPTPYSIAISDESIFRDVPDMIASDSASGVSHDLIAANDLERDDVSKKMNQCSVRDDIHSSDEIAADSDASSSKSATTSNETK